MTEQLAIGTAQVPLHEHLRRIPRHAILQWENPSKEPWDLAFSSAPVGLLAHQAADALDPASEARQPSVSDLRDANNRAHDRKVRLSAALIRLVEHFERVDASEHDKAAIKAATDVWSGVEVEADTDAPRQGVAIAGGYVATVSERDAAIAYRARIACDILEGFTDGIDGDRLGELARWVTRGRALDNVALHRAFAAPWIAAADEAGWEGDADIEAVKDIDRHTITARVRGATSFTPDQLATIFARHNELKAAAANALEVANSHIQHMAAWISKTNASDTPLHGYSFEALGEDKWIIDQALASLKSEALK